MTSSCGFIIRRIYNYFRDFFENSELAEKSVYLLFGIINFERGRGKIIIIYGYFVSLSSRMAGRDTSGRFVSSRGSALRSLV